ncbi:MAG: extracellular solute-binding protein [Propionivibrio sp.]
MRSLACLFCALALALPPLGGRAAEVVLVASSFPKEILTAYKKAFDEQSAEYRVEFVNFPGTNAISYVRDRAPGSRPDVFWGSSPDTFSALKRLRLLQPLDGFGNAEIPPVIGKLSIDDPEHFHRGQALSGYGIMWNRRYLDARGIPVPAAWSDLARPEYFGHIVMSSASRSSTTHLIVESILQGAGWDAGWALILQIAGNCATITERSFDVPNSITRGRFGLGPVVDFLALSGKYSGFPVDFAYAWPSVITPVGIGLINGARNPEGGKAFIAFTLSEAGQRLLLRPEISRLPVLPKVYETADRPADYPDLFDITRSYLPAYAPEVSESRYQMVGALFDQSVTFRHSELVAITKTIHEVAKRLQSQPDADAAALLDKARALVYRAPIAENDDLLARKPLKTRERIAAIAAREAEWARQTDRNLAAARSWLAQANDRLGRQP